jgi:tol-pal system protein YbgF
MARGGRQLNAQSSTASPIALLSSAWVRPSARFGIASALLVALVPASFAPLNFAWAQQAPPAGYTPARPANNAAAKSAAAPKAAAAAKAEPAAPAANEGGLRQRVEQLEEQLVEMQVAIGTLESLSKGGSSSSGVYRGGSSEGGAGGADAGKVAALETQIRALATQVDQLSQQLRQSNAQRASAPAPAAIAAAPPLAAAPVPPSSASADPIGRLVGNAAPQGDAPVASLPQAGASDASAKQAYETAYGYLLQQDFGAAEAAFDDFLKRFPSDALAGNAQYWLGETYFARGQFKPAASAFLKGYQTYARSAKAPDSVLKLAMSLDKLGQKDAACASYAELTTKFPNAPGHVKNRADTERRRLGCS